MKTLKPLGLTRLSNLEFGQHIKSIEKGISSLPTPVTNAILLDYLSKITNLNTNFDLAMVQISKSDETQKIVEADKKRDIAFNAFKRLVYVYELSDNEAELLAFASLQTLLNAYDGIATFNFEKETNGLQNLITDLGNPQYTPHVTLLNLTNYILRLNTANVEFATFFEGRTQEESIKTVYDVKQLRIDIKVVYDDVLNYVLAMAKSLNTDEFNNSLNIINTIREYYNTLLAKRKSNNDSTFQIPMPPTE